MITWSTFERRSQISTKEVLERRHKSLGFQYVVMRFWTGVLSITPEYRPKRPVVNTFESLEFNMLSLSKAPKQSTFGLGTRGHFW